MADAVLVTGASTGIGEACALLLAEGGDHVYAGVRKQADGDRVAGELAAGAKGSITPVLLDVTDEAQVAEVAARIDAEVGAAGLTAVVNNAGIARGGPLEHLPLDDWRLQLEVNVIGQVAVTKAVLPLLRRAHAGRIVFIGSISGRISTPLMGPYGASKHALEAIAESLRHELRPSGIRVSLVEPGAVKTAIWDKGRELADELEASLGGEALDEYRPFVDAVRKGIEDQDRTGVAPVKVAEVVAKAVHGDRPKPRYVVGKDAKAGAFVARFVPDRPRDVILAKLAGP
jgi:NAD(P)-dependent dehydrogenase (short-subunit alcohol dehydrogenase family)